MTLQLALKGKGFATSSTLKFENLVMTVHMLIPAAGGVEHPITF